MKLNLHSLDENDQWVVIGRYYGYPDCCIAAFPNKSNREVSIHQHQGFLPCEKCAERIKKGEIKIEDLIQNRQQSTPYPIGGDYQEALTYFKNQIKNKKQAT